MSERVIADPVAVAGSSRRELDLTPFIGEDGPDWGDAKVEQFKADQMVGSLPIAYTVPNRVVSIPLLLLDRGAYTFAAVRSMIQALAGLWQESGGWISRTINVGEIDEMVVYADVVDASFKLGGGTAQALWGVDADAVLVIETLPDWYGDEIALDVMRGTGEIVGVLQQDGVDAVIEGDFPAGNRCRVVVRDTSGTAQRGLIAAFRGRNQSSDAMAALRYEAELFTPRDSASQWGDLTGAYPNPSVGGNTIRHTSLATSWTPVLDTTLVSGGADLTHVGTYRAITRVYSADTSAGSVSVRLVWDVNDLVAPSENSAWTIPDAGKFYLADLGIVRLARGPAGDSRWLGQIQARGALGGENIYIDTVWLVPADEYAAFLTAAPADAGRGLAGFTAHDEFNQTAGSLTGQTLPVGGRWSGAGDADDFTVDTTARAAKRTATGDTGSGFSGSRFVVASGTAGMADQGASIDIRWEDVSSIFVTSALLLRYTDVNNWFALKWLDGFGLAAWRRVAGREAPVAITLNGKAFPADAGLPLTARGIALRLSAVVTADGSFFGSIGYGDSKLYQFAGGSSALATGGALARGSAGFFDNHSGANAISRYYDNFACWTPETDAVIFASTAAELRTEGHFREDSTGTGLGPVADAVGNLPRLPSSGVTGNPTELFLKPSRGDLDQLPDSALDTLTAQVFHRPCWLGVPGT